MSDSAQWYAKKLAAMRGAPAPQQVAQPPQYPPVAPAAAPGQLPAHLAPYAQQQVPAAYHPTMPSQQQQPQGMVPQSFYSYDANTGAQVADDGHVAMLYNSAAQTGGSKMVKEHSRTCPNCNGGNYFEIQEGGQFSKEAKRVVHAAQCADCGYPKVQSGSTGGALGGRSGGGGPAQKARQLPPNHRVTISLEGGGYATFEPPTSAMR